MKIALRACKNTIKFIKSAKTKILFAIAMSMLPMADVWAGGTNNTTTNATTNNATTNAMQGFYAVTGGQQITQSGLVIAIANGARDIFGLLSAAAGLFGIVYIFLGGLTLMGGGGKKKEEGMERIKWAFIGLGVALSAGVLAAISALLAGDFTKGL